MGNLGCFHVLVILNSTAVNIGCMYLFRLNFSLDCFVVPLKLSCYCKSKKERKKVKSLSRVWLFATSQTVACQAPPSMGSSRQEYWSALPFPSPGDLPNPVIKPGSPALQADSLPSESQGKPQSINCTSIKHLKNIYRYRYRWMMEGRNKEMFWLSNPFCPPRSASVPFSYLLTSCWLYSLPISLFYSLLPLRNKQGPLLASLCFLK